MKADESRCGWRRTPGRLGVLAWSPPGAGCASAIAAQAPQAAGEVTCVRPVPQRDVLVGVALSGGGSRAALFGAAGLEALGRVRAPGGGSVLDQVAYLSSVSGGSLAAAYYASQKPPRETPVLTPDGTLTAEYQAFFARSKERCWPRTSRARSSGASSACSAGSTPPLAARSLAEILEERLLGQTTFGDLAQRETRGDSPRLIVNTTLYNNGRRLVFTTLPRRPRTTTSSRTWRRSLARRGTPPTIPPILDKRWAELLPVTPLDLEIDPCPVPWPGRSPRRPRSRRWSGRSPSGWARRNLLAHRGWRALREPRHRVPPASCS